MFLMFRGVFPKMSALMLDFAQHIKPMNLEEGTVCCHLKGKCGNHNCWVKGLANLIFAHGFSTDSSCLIYVLQAFCALLRVSGTVSPSTTNPPGDITTYKPLYIPRNTLVILYHKPRFHLCTWLYPDSKTFHAQLNELCRQTGKYTQIHTKL